MLKKKVLVICLGSSCFARGNKFMVQIIKKFIDDHGLLHKVEFKGKHCFGSCENGPVLLIDEHKYERITADSIPEILEKELLN